LLVASGERAYCVSHGFGLDPELSSDLGRSLVSTPIIENRKPFAHADGAPITKIDVEADAFIHNERLRAPFLGNENDAFANSVAWSAGTIGLAIDRHGPRPELVGAKDETCDLRAARAHKASKAQNFARK
jgi:hypothetical protein